MTINFFDALNRWKEIREQITKLKAEEAVLRQGLFGAAFPQPREGTNTYKLPNGQILKGVHKFTRKVFVEKLPEVDQALETIKSESRSRDFLSWTPNLLDALYKQAPSDVRSHLDRAIETKPAKPVLTVEAKE